LRGRGIVYYTDNTGIFNERHGIALRPEWRTDDRCRPLSHGQGHETSYAQMCRIGSACRRTDPPRQADTDETGGDRPRHLRLAQHDGGGQRIARCRDEVIERGKRFAAHFMEADAADIIFSDGNS